MEEAEAECELAEVPEQCCSGWPSSATGAGSTAPESKAEASGSRSPGCSAPGCSAPAGQNHAWVHLLIWTKDFMSKDIAEINSDGYDIFLQERLRHDKVDRIEWTVLPPTI